MSSEEAMSVVGSEVMPLDYGSMDSESSPSPTSSERTVEERRDHRVVEEGEDEIPSNILEAGNRGDGCYDPDLDIVSEAGGRGEKGWYYFGPWSSSKGNRSLFSTGPSSIKGWKEKFFFVDDTEWSRRDAEVEQLFVWKAKKTKQNNYKLNEDEVEEVEKLVREDGDVVDILYLTSPKAIEAAELYGLSSLSEAEMDEFINATRGLHIPKKPRKKSKTSTAAEKGVAERGRLSSTFARAVEVQSRPEPVMGGSEDGEGRGRGARPWWGQGAHPSSRVLEEFEATNTTGAKHFLNSTLPEVDRVQAKDEVVSHLGYTVVWHALESASWTNALAQEYAESKEKGEWEKEKEKREMQRRLDEVLPSVTELQNENDVLSTKLVLEERKRKICEEKLEAQDKYIDNMSKGAAELKKNVNLLVHNGMEEHIGNFLNSSTFENILKLYWLPTAIVVFTDCRKKVNAQYPEITLRWERDAEGLTIFPPAFDVELVAVEEEEGEEEAQGVGVEDQAALAEVQPPEVHPVSSDEVQTLAPPEAEVPPQPAEDEPRSPTSSC
ncbi:hypothetical protein SLEP1_g54621 [Rubroshorea leprosula]|uniref:Uncharacterized protein n=1 Tax=Rubroshorea leprosula TaxID=152421 RepID=A0AAV5MFI4_9ROSI|nr:hypothetical protein SLEP1_g54621 [Rubroshorea leprosula]